MPLHAPPKVRNPAVMTTIFAKTVKPKPSPTKDLNRLGVLFFKSSQKSCDEQCASMEHAAIEINIKIDGEKKWFPFTPKEGRLAIGSDSNKTLPAAKYGEVGSALMTMKILVSATPVTPKILTGAKADNDLSFVRGYSNA